ncbi:MAG: arsenate reductase ArsC [Anaerolineales bacterium]|nr:arsenate reductase ArsC [Anaerolineales bacterium]
MESKPKMSILFLCTHNSARSQLAEGLLRWLGGESVEVYSAGTEKTQVKPAAAVVMKELGVDISGQFSKTLARYVDQHFDVVITVCDQANETCPIFPNAARRLHWSIEDPSASTSSQEVRLQAFRLARDELRTRIQAELLPMLKEHSVG